MIAERIFFILLGTACLIGGYTLYRWGIRAVGAFLGSLAGIGFWRVLEEFVLAEYLNGPYDSRIGLVLSAIAFAVLGMVLAIRFYMILLFLATFLGGLYIVYTRVPGKGLRVFELIESTEAFQWLYGHVGDSAPALVVLVISMLLLLLHRHMVIIASAVTGAYLVAVETYTPLFVPLLVVGLICQITGRRRSGRASTVEEE